MMSVKELIYDTLSTLDIPIAYHFSDLTRLPHISYSLIHHQSIRASNKRHQQVAMYQIDFFSDHTLDVANDAVLWKIVELLEAQHLVVGDWQEVAEVDEDKVRAAYRYYVEVSG